MQRERYRARLELMADGARPVVGRRRAPAGGRLLPLVRRSATPGRFAERLAREGGALVSPGEFYGPQGADYVRVAVVQPDDRLDLVVERLGVS